MSIKKETQPIPLEPHGNWIREQHGPYLLSIRKETPRRVWIWVRVERFNQTYTLERACVGSEREARKLARTAMTKSFSKLPNIIESFEAEYAQARAFLLGAS